MNILLTGCNGQLGIEIKRQLTQTDQTIRLFETDVHNLDITDGVQVFHRVLELKPEVIINCAAYTNVDGCEEDQQTAFRVNAVGAQNLSVAAYELGAKMIQISTDYVFDGNTNLERREYDPVNPLSIYGKSKALGETLVRETNPKHFILRTAWLYGEGNNFVRTMLKLARERDELKVVNDQIGSPTSTVDLAACIIDLMRTQSYGTYHATNEGFCSWYDFAKKIFELAKIPIQVNPITTEQLNRPAPRPKFSVLDNFMLKLINENSFRTWEEALKEYLLKEKLDVVA